MSLDDYHVTHLRALEAEAIHIIHEVVSEFRNPVMLFSVGGFDGFAAFGAKAFAPGKLPFCCMSIRPGNSVKCTNFAIGIAENDIELLVHINQEGKKQGLTLRPIRPCIRIS